MNTDTVNVDSARRRFGYFVLQAKSAQSPSGAIAVSLAVEDLRTGEKRTFESSTELRRFIDEWAGLASGDDRFAAPGGGRSE